MEEYGKELPGKDALAVSANPQGGGQTRIRASWNENGWLSASKLNAQIARFSTDEMPRGFPFELRELAADMARAGLDGEQVATGAYRRLLAKKETRPQFLELTERITGVDRLKEIADALVVGHFLSREAFE